MPKGVLQDIPCPPLTNYSEFSILSPFSETVDGMKLKTHKALSKRLRVTKTGKVIKRRNGQGHFNSRNPGKITRKKRRDQQFADAHEKAVQTLMPYSDL